MNSGNEDIPGLRRRIRHEMGGTAKVRSIHLAGKRTARDFLAVFSDEDSFLEIGTFAGMPAGAPPTAAGDGRIAGVASVGGSPVGIIVDDVTVKRASSTTLNARKAERVFHVAKRAGLPVLFFGEAGGARLPDTMKSEVFASEPVYPWLFDEQRPPLLTAIVGESYGGSSFMAAMSDVTVMLKGSVMALTSPRVITMATGATPAPEELGGADVLAARTDLVDVVVDDYAELDQVLRRCLAFFTDPCTAPGPRRTCDLRDLVPADESQVYDVRAVIAGIADEGSFQELGAERGRSLVTGLGRVDGRVVGFVASQPLHEAGALSPVGCAKAERLTRLCSRFDFPIVALVDTPGFQIGLEVEHAGMLRRAMDLIKTNTAAPCPVVTLILRKAFGLAFFAMFSPDHGGDVVLAWPDAHVGFMAPATAANVLYGEEYAHLAPDVRRIRLSERAESLGSSSKVQDVAAAMGIDEIVDEVSTVSTIRSYLNLLAPRTDPARATGRKIDL